MKAALRLVLFPLETTAAAMGRLRIAGEIPWPRD
jgi:hypothetical protein